MLDKKQQMSQAVNLTQRAGPSGAVFSNVDLLVTPSTAVPPPTIEEAVRLGIELELIRNTAPFNVYGLPTISIPCALMSSGLPIGMQITGPPFAEARVLALAHAYEQATDWHRRRPYAVLPLNNQR